MPAAIGREEAGLSVFLYSHETALELLVDAACHAMSKFGQCVFPVVRLFPVPVAR